MTISQDEKHKPMREKSEKNHNTKNLNINLECTKYDNYDGGRTVIT